MKSAEVQLTDLLRQNNSIKVKTIILLLNVAIIAMHDASLLMMIVDCCFSTLPLPPICYLTLAAICCAPALLLDVFGHQLVACSARCHDPRL